MIVVAVDVLGDPVPKARPRHNPNGSHYLPPRTQAAQDAMAWALLEARGPKHPVKVPVSVVLKFRCKTRRRCDIDNLAKLVLDAGNGVAYVDDQQVERLVVLVERGVARPSTHVLITTEV